jgi:starch-binding outer membrane protein, SusD/RagB family
MKRIVKYLSLLMIFLTVYSCTEKDLEFESTQINYVAYYQTDDQVSAALTAAYDPMGYVWFFRAQRWGASLKTWGNFASDDAYAGGADQNDQPTYQQADNYTVSPSDPSFGLESMWGYYFKGIYRSNLIIVNVKPDTKFKKFAIAEAKFTKAFYYFYLARMFGGLPLIDNIPLPTDVIPRATQDETFTYIETLLVDAIGSGDLQERSGGADPGNGLATIASAQALLGKVYMYHKKYTEAISTLSAVATNAQYALEPAFWRIHKGTNLHGIESVFEINFSNVLFEGNADIYLFGPRGSVLFNDTVTSGWGFNQPTQSLVDAFTAQNDLIRLNATVFRSDTLQSWYNKTTGAVSPIVWVHNITDYWDRKHYPDPNLSVGNVFNRFTNPDVVLRLGDVYLMLAEAYVRTGDNSNALTYINLIRSRAHLPALTAVTLPDVKKERRLELALEGERYFDLVRWTGDPDLIDADHELGIPDDAKGITATNNYAIGTPGTKTKGLFPIPQVEINATSGPNKLVQNDGY